MGGENDEMKEHLCYRIGVNLLQLRHLKGMLQAEVAKKVGIPVRTLSVLESGRSNPTLKLLARLATFYHVPIERLFADQERSAFRASNFVFNKLSMNVKYKEYLLKRGEKKEVIIPKGKVLMTKPLSGQYLMTGEEPDIYMHSKVEKFSFVPEGRVKIIGIGIKNKLIAIELDSTSVRL